MAAEDTKTYNDQLQRIMLVTGKHSLTTLAEELGVGMPAMTDARRRGKIPADWLLTLTMKKGVNPEWLLTGQGPVLSAAFPPLGPVILTIKKWLKWRPTGAPCNASLRACWPRSCSGASFVRRLKALSAGHKKRRPRPIGRSRLRYFKARLRSAAGAFRLR